jgi:hypothetical protein
MLLACQLHQPGESGEWCRLDEQMWQVPVLAALPARVQQIHDGLGRKSEAAINVSHVRIQTQFISAIRLASSEEGGWREDVAHHASSLSLIARRCAGC